MQYYLANPALDEQVADVRRRIRLAQNGVVAEHMAARGAAYRQNDLLTGGPRFPMKI